MIVVLFTGHCGSSWFTSLLGSHPQLLQVGSEPIDAFHEKGLNPSEHINEMLASKSLNGFPKDVQKILCKGNLEAFNAGLKTSKNIVFKTRSLFDREEELFKTTIPEKAKYIILMRRRNKLKNAVSKYKRSVLGVSHLGKKQSAKDKMIPVKVVPWDIQLQAVRYTRRDLLDIRLFDIYTEKYNIPGRMICYEDILDADVLKKTMDGITADLGLNSYTPQSDYKKVTSDVLSEAVQNYPALKRKMQGSVFEACLTDDSYDPALLIKDGSIPAPSIVNDDVEINI